MATFGPINSPDIVSQSAMRQQSRLARLLASVAMTAIFTAGLGGCQTMSDITGSITSKSEPNATAETDPRRAVDAYGERYRANPKDPEAALAYGQALRSTGQRAQAVAVFEQATIAHPSNKALLAGFGRALVDNGNFQQAFDVLSRAHSPDNPDWRILSVQGTALDQLGRHDEARRYYASALKIVPEEPTVLSNLGLSYVLSKELPKAEEVLRRAYASGKADARVRQNLALVVGLQGRFGEAETIVKADLPADEAAANVGYLKEMLNRKDNPRAGNGSIPVASFGDRRTE
jgi:Flp pilus assembly protein TadD